MWFKNTGHAQTQREYITTKKIKNFGIFIARVRAKHSLWRYQPMTYQT